MRHTTIRIARLLLSLCLLAQAGPAAADARPLTLEANHAAPIGRHTAWLRERGEPLRLDEAVAAFERGAFRQSRDAVPTFGIGSDPVWIHFRAHNLLGKRLPRELSIGTAWLDRVDIFVRHDGDTTAHATFGDRVPFRQRPMEGRDFAYTHAFAPGDSDVFLRVATPDPMVIPIRLELPAAAAARQQRLDYAYGFLYGFLCALIAYNLMLFAGLRERRYVLYSAYLATFLVGNLSYTGHAFAWFWPQSTSWAQWSQPTLMMLYAATGLAFALNFLEMRTLCPRVHRWVLGYIAGGAALLAACALADWQAGALLLAFTYVSGFSVIMVALGIMSVRGGHFAGRYFLAAAVCAMTGVATTSAAVWGAIPFTVWAFHAVDAGMLLDATLLALAVTYQFRVVREERRHAQELARHDPLTGLLNRRAFHEVAIPVWHLAARNDRDLSVILLDIDRFKRVNDTFGHATGDEVLQSIAHIIEATVRHQDLAARWGGEEFVLLLPETALDRAAALAERLRATIATSRVAREGREIGVTVSIGVACRASWHGCLEDLITAADRHLYVAKENGRDRVSHALVRGIDAVFEKDCSTA